MSHNQDGLDGLSADMKNNRKLNLHLNVYAKWFKLLEDGTKTEDYRELSAHWHRMLQDRVYETVTIRNGFDPLAPEAVFAFAGVEIGAGRTEWGAPGSKTMYIIKLGRKLRVRNYGEVLPQKNAETTKGEA